MRSKWKFYVDSGTTFTTREGQASSFADLQPGIRLFVRAEFRFDGKWWAVNVKAGRRTGAPQATAVTTL